MTMSLSTGLISGMDTGSLVTQLIAAEGAPCTSASAETACRQVRPPHHPIPARVTRLIVFGARCPAVKASRSAPNVTFSQRQMIVSSVGRRQSPPGTRKSLCIAP